MDEEKEARAKEEAEIEAFQNSILNLNNFYPVVTI